MRAPDYERTASAIEAVRQRKYARWAKEMADHGWTVAGPRSEDIPQIAARHAQARREAAGAST